MAAKQDDGERRPRSGDLILDSEPPQPPQPPDVEKGWRYFPVQLVGIPLLVLISIAAMLGAFGDDTGKSTAGDGLTVDVEYPTRFRFKQVDPLSVTVTNGSGASIRGVTVMVDSRYLESFSQVSFTPTPSQVGEEWWVFDLGALAPGSTAVVAGQVQAESFWVKKGTVRVGADGIEPVEVSFSTLVFP